MGDLHDRLTYLEERLKALDKFDAPLGPANGSESRSYGQDLNSVHNRMQSAADFLGQEFVSRYEQVQRDVQRQDNGFLPVGGTNGSHVTPGRIGDTPEWLAGLGGDDAGLSELNSLYAVVQDIKRDLSIMSSPPKPPHLAGRSAASRLSPPREPSSSAPLLLPHSHPYAHHPPPPPTSTLRDALQPPPPTRTLPPTTLTRTTSLSLSPSLSLPPTADTPTPPSPRPSRRAWDRRLPYKRSPRIRSTLGRRSTRGGTTRGTSPKTSLRPPTWAPGTRGWRRRRSWD